MKNNKKDDTEKIAKDVDRFKFELLRKLPFYGDILMRLPIVENSRIPTACTNGRKIEYSKRFFSTLNQGQRNFVLMHETLHVILFHCKRQKGDQKLWNTAQDIVVNHMLMRLTGSMHRAGIPFDRPPDGIFNDGYANETADNIYAKLLEINKDKKIPLKKVIIMTWAKKTQQVNAPDDIILPPDFDSGEYEVIAVDPAALDDGDGGLNEQALLRIIRESATKNRSSMGSYFVPEQIYKLTASKTIKWQALLRNFFVQELSDEVSYATPERKYIHMDLILPGHSIDDERIEEVWAFVDSSGSIGHNTMEQFLTQLYRISKDFKCVFNIAYWDTEVTDVYKNILKKEDILKSIPHHMGGTDINCVYRWIGENKVKPYVMLILTDGYFGSLDSDFIPTLRKKTVLVLDGAIDINEDMKRIGKITRL